jgi:hypothetical protein
MKTLLAILLFAASAIAQTNPHSVTLTWTYIPGAGTFPASGFQVLSAPCATTACNGPGTFTNLATVGPTVLTYVDTSAQVVAGATVFYEVETTSTGGNSSPSAVVSAAIPFSLPAAPATLQAVPK